ncbi:leucine--tRNA ligase [Leptospira wolffii]|uniref:leucine--tRNA ligase n=1 Tax=Leptospira wolffii TaxID=409998 RepID=UPI00034D6058|nr:leucine--tRNA ligase [Leptospira wolffii]TGK61591.1 leucine--tRNA ligase [Leptospira wolffii]TGK70135.1 leucine--tRNA ligase [Leptospira wolffii]TGK77058.1 leucine--tRNA ligase [Leptospira wolffii]TGL31090.1 leucine--tRNA ligase [Leptospira wolffii]
MDYPFQEIESKWQSFWEKNASFRTDLRSSKPKFYCLDMFPYPSGAGLHVGHPEGYTATDIVSRYKRMKGFEVLHPMGWDAFGLPAERYAMQTGIHPAITTKQNVDNFRRQIKLIGLSYDWDREISTTDPKYYKFTQWIFLKLYESWYDFDAKKAKPISELLSRLEKQGSQGFEDLESFSAQEWKAFSESQKEQILSGFRLVYQAEIPVNWCPGLGTVLANEEVEEWVGKGYEVVRKPMRQYMMRITAYAERLLEDLGLVTWPQSTLEMQKNWIGKSEGLELIFPFEENTKRNFEAGKNSLEEKIRNSRDLNFGGVKVYTTRPDTVFGVTYMVLAPEHPLVDLLTSKEQWEKVQEYKKVSALKSDLDRTELSKEKSGVFTGAYVLNPADPAKKIPIWIGDYVLYGYGTGAIMAVPAHDQRDYEFAKAFSLEIQPVIEGDFSQGAFDSKESVCIHSSGPEVSIDGLGYKEAFAKISDWSEKKGIGKRKIQFKLRDWLFARQRYWGEPIPLVHFPSGVTKTIPESELPLELPNLSEFKPSGTGESPLALAGDWLKYKDPATGEIGTRETNTMPQWAGSCWYYLRYIDPENPNRFVDPDLEKSWMPVDLYVGGAEHAVLHLLYSRFWHKVLFDLGYVTTPEPFKKLVHQGLILGEDKRKMSKSLGNVINPDEVVSNFGADSLRLFEMFMGPFEMVKPWSTRGVEGVFRFLNRVWRLYHGGPEESFRLDDTDPNEDELKILHRTIKKIEDDINQFSFNTAISQLMIFVNELTPNSRRPRKVLETFLLLIAPFAPHLAEELWSLCGKSDSLTYEPFPKVEEKYLVDDEILIVVQVNGKLRGEFKAPKEIGQEDAIRTAKALDKVQVFLDGKQIRKEIYVPGKLVNLVVG